MNHPARGQETESQVGYTWCRLIDSGDGKWRTQLFGRPAGAELASQYDGVRLS